MSKIGNDKVVSNNNQRIAAVHKHLASSKTEIPVAGELYKSAQIVAAFQKSLDAQAAVVTAHAEYKAAVALRRTAEIERRTVDDALKSWVLNRFKADSTVAHEFGYAARKQGEPSAETKAKAVLLAQATRLARGTMGKKQKQKIKGVIPTPATATAPPQPAPATTAAPATPAVNVATHGTTNGVALA